MAEQINIVDPYENYEFQETEFEPDVNFLEQVESLQVGFGSKVLRIDRDGLWLGGEEFATAPFKVDMDGNITAATLDLSGFLSVGEALADVQSDIFDLADIDNDLGYIVAGTLVGVEVRGSLIRTSTSGDRVEIDDSTNNVEVYDSGGTLRMELDQDELIFYNSLGNDIGKIHTPTSSNFYIEAPSGNYLILDAKGANAASAIALYAGGSVKMLVSYNGLNIYDDLHIDGVVTFDQDLEADGGLEDIGDTQAFDHCYAEDFFGIYNAPSDRRLKTNIAEIPSALDDIMQMRPVTFNYKPKKYKQYTDAEREANPEKVIDKELLAQERNAKRVSKVHYGFIAQEVEKILPALVNETNRKKGDNYKSLKYDEVVPLLVKAIQEQQEVIDALVAKVNP